MESEKHIIETIRREIEQSQRPLLERIEELEQQVDAVDDWAHGVYLALDQILPSLLRNHPEAETIQKALQENDDRFEELLAYPRRAKEGEQPGMYEACKMLNRQLAILGVWPNIDAGEAARQTLERVARQRTR
ncbi:hypothetical protein [Methylogaea oryzae]|uniref:Uncharacterized protein n=1 Tax=Methylogaea oryzae TaxID=1295382 RepID=A0A8D4VNQ4_9GAMM|nr:hypothetical protein [Methylogaea oryzae]BBL69715.1 hypothetical protein MoryE10_03210 [Methylogaea oryzae]